MVRFKLFVFGCFLIGCCLAASGCSFRVDALYHGRTGIDDRTSSPQFVPAAEKRNARY